MGAFAKTFGMGGIIPKWLFVKKFPATSLVAEMANSTQINLSWLDTIDKVSVERSLNGIDYTEIATVTEGVRAYSNTGLTPGNVYYYRVRAFIGTHYSAYSNVSSFDLFRYNLLYYWSLTEANGNVLESVNNIGYPVIGGTAPPDMGATGHTGKALLFNGSFQSFPILPTLPAINVYSVSFWGKRNTIPGTKGVLFDYENSGYGSFYVCENGDIKMTVTNGTDRATWAAVWTDKTLFHNLVFVSDGTHIELFFDGISKGKIAWVMENMVYFRIGANRTGYAYYYAGTIEDVGIWGRAITQSEITALQNRDIVFILNDDMKYSNVINLNAGNTVITTTLTLEPYSILLFDSSGNEITNAVTITCSIVAGVYQLAFYSVEAVLNVKLKIIY